LVQYSLGVIDSGIRTATFKQRNTNEVNRFTRLYINQVLHKLIWQEPGRHSSSQTMHAFTACASCAMHTADKFNHSAAGTLHPHHTETQQWHIPASIELHGKFHRIRIRKTYSKLTQCSPTVQVNRTTSNDVTTLTNRKVAATRDYYQFIKNINIQSSHIKIHVH